VLGIHDFPVFLAAGIALNLTPGQDTFYILGRSIAQGRRAGIASVLGISTGSVIHTCAAALGLSALLAASASAFLAVKLAGAAYLVYLGLRLLLGRAPVAAVTGTFTSAGFLAVYRQGLITNVLNPKVALFFLAFMPQFIAADSAHKILAFLALGSCFVTTGTIWCFCLAWFAARIARRLQGGTRFAAWTHRAAGALFILLGVRLAATR
jgi:threonine/homoserine/homoserine lactone efflux protein